MLQLGIFAAPGGMLIMDASYYARNVEFSTNEHGFESLSCELALPLADAFRLYDRPGLPHVYLGNGVDTVWEGRLEDVAIIDSGVRLTALGYWRALSDVPYTGIWAWSALEGAGGLAEWREVTPLDIAGRDPGCNSMYTVPDATVGGMIIAPRKGETFGSPTYNAGEYTYETPISSSTQIVEVTFNYTLVASSPWTMLLKSYTRAWGSVANEWSLVGDGGVQDGTVTVTLAAPRDRISFQFYLDDTAATFGGDTGSAWARMGQITIRTTSASVTSDLIVNALISYVNGINSTQLSSSTALVAAPGVTLTDEVYEDELPANVLTKLANLGDNQTPPKIWETGVWEDRKLHFRLRGSAGRRWFVDAASLSLERSLDEIYNSAYAIYQDTKNISQRTAIETDGDSVSRYGLTRRSAVKTSTTGATQAGVQLDAFIYDRKNPLPKAEISIPELYNDQNIRVPLWMARSGDTITIRNLSPTVSAEADRIRTMLLIRTNYNVDTDVLTVEPEGRSPRMEMFVARLGEGFWGR